MLKFNQQFIDFMGQLVCCGFLDIFFGNKQPQIVFQMSADSMGLEGSDLPKDKRALKQQIRVVMLDNTQHVLSREQIAAKIKDIQTKQTDIGFSYTADGLRIIIVPEDMTILTPHGSTGVPLGTGQG